MNANDLFLLVPLAVVVAIVGLAWYRRLTDKPSEFAAGVARSITRDLNAWDYSDDETWLCSHKANLSISLQPGNFGRCNIWSKPNTGSSHIVTFVGADLRAFKRAVNEWRALTAIDRQHIAEKRKRDALQAMAA